jgi:hypothetical protein
MTYTYKNLLDALSKLTNEQLNMMVTVVDNRDETYAVILDIIEEDDVLDSGHPYFRAH